MAGYIQVDFGETTIHNWPPKHHMSQQRKAAGFSAGLIPVHSQLLGESLLVSFPPLTDMLKFSGYSHLN